MSSYVLVGGAWIGAWAWREMARDLRSAGHDVHPVTLTGLGDRAHLGGPDTDLETHITDVVAVVEAEDLRDVVLVGHSYAGIVVTGVADRIPDRLGHLVYLDSAPMEDGERLLDLYPPEAAEQVRRQVEAAGDGWRLPFPGVEGLAAEASLTGLGERERTLLEARAVAQPFGTYTQPLRLTRAGGSYQRVIIACEDMQAMTASGFPRFAPLTRAPWRWLELPTGHWPMLSTPSDLADLLGRVVTEPVPAGTA